MNKTDSAVRITHLPTGIVVQCQNERSQTSNKATALRILKSRLAEPRGGEARGRARAGARRRAGHRLRSQIRSYVLHPYQLVKDHRTDFEVGNTQSVLDGGLDGFVHAYLLAKAAGQVVTPRLRGQNVRYTAASNEPEQPDGLRQPDARCRMTSRRHR